MIVIIIMIIIIIIFIIIQVVIVSAATTDQFCRSLSVLQIWHTLMHRIYPPNENTFFRNWRKLGFCPNKGGSDRIPSFYRNFQSHKKGIKRAKTPRTFSDKMLILSQLFNFFGFLPSFLGIFSENFKISYWNLLDFSWTFSYFFLPICLPQRTPYRSALKDHIGKELIGLKLFRPEAYPAGWCIF